MHAAPMSDHRPTDSIRLQPSWKYFFFSYLTAVLTIPLAGIGLIILYFVRRKQISIDYLITNTRITAVDEKYEHNVDLADIRDIGIEQSWLNRQLGIGTLNLQTSASQMKLLGLEKPAEIRDILQQAITAEHRRLQQQQQRRKRETGYRPGSMDRMEYLTGLWQQGLISDEDYKAERKNFE